MAKTPDYINGCVYCGTKHRKIADPFDMVAQQRRPNMSAACLKAWNELSDEERIALVDRALEHECTSKREDALQELREELGETV